MSLEPYESSDDDESRHRYPILDRRRGSIFREMLGTAAVVLPLAVGFGAFLTNISERTALNTQAISTLREQRSEVLGRLEKIDDKLDGVRFLIQQSTREINERGDEGRARAAARRNSGYDADK